MNTFEEYLQSKHAEDYHGTDDDMPDNYEAWLMNIDTDQVIELAQQWGNKMRKDILTDIEVIIKSYEK